MYRHILLELKKVKAALEEQGHRCEITGVTQYEEIAQEAEKLGAVSYTHLDVYKRQVVEVVYGIPVWHKGGKEA